MTISYYNSAAFRCLSPSTQRTYRNVIERFRAEHGDKSTAGLRRDHIQIMRDAKAETPAAANIWLKCMRALLGHAVETGLRDDNPALSVKRVRTKTQGFPTWSEEDIAKFVHRWPFGTRQRLAFELLLCTGQRRSDIVRMGPQHIRAGILRIRQKKTGTEVAIPVHENLKRSINATETGDLAFLITSLGKPFSAAGFGNWFAEAVREAGLADRAAHGLRKAACRRLAEAGCSAHEIMAISGHKNLSEVQCYTEAASRLLLARAAFGRLRKEQGLNENLQTDGESLLKRPKK